MKEKPRKPKRKFAGDLALRTDAPVNLTAYRLAERVFWFQATHGEGETLQALYDRILKLLQRESGHI